MLPYAPEPGPIPDNESDRRQLEWNNRERERIGRSLLTVHDLDVFESPTLIKGKPREGMVRYFRDTPLGYGPGPYCYVCVPDIPSPGQTFCYWEPMFPVTSNFVQETMIDQAVGIPSATWTTVATLNINQRFGRRLHISSTTTGGTMGRTDINLGYRFLDNGVSVHAITTPEFGFDHEFRNVNVDQYYQSHSITGFIAPQFSSMSLPHTIELQAYSDIVAAGNVAVVDDWNFFVKED